jgi:peptidoglycan/xylan/chitin deacetylase (PgdA/CDA1 family)
VKFVALSYDDATLADERFIALLNRYGMKATLHLNAGLYRPLHPFKNGSQLRLPLNVMRSLYRHHEVAAHGFTHPDLTGLTREQIDAEINQDIDLLNRDFKQRTIGFAYPYGTYTPRVVERIKASGLLYARTIKNTHNFTLPQNLWHLHPTCHDNDPKLPALIEKFLALPDSEDALFLIWGHSYEIDVEQRWSSFEENLKRLSRKKGVHYGTLGQALKAFNLI